MKDHEANIQTLRNGATLVCIPNHGLRSVVVLAALKVGSRHEAPGYHGAAHFLEHMLFKGTVRRPTSKEINAEIDARGGQHNAFTDRELTGFHVHMAAPDAAVAVDLVHDMLDAPLLTSRDVQRERLVIQEEIELYENDPGASVWDVSSEATFEGTSLGRTVTGTAADITFSAAALRKFFRAHYVPSRMVVILAGAITPALVALARKKFSSLTREFAGAEMEPLVEPRRVGLVFRAGNTDRAHVVIRFPAAHLSSPQRWEHDLLSMILGGYSSARLPQALREERGLCYDVGASFVPFHDVGSLFVNTEVAVENFGQTMKVIAAQLRELSRDGVSADELRAAKQNLRGARLMAMDSPMTQAMNAAYQLLGTGAYQSPEVDLAEFERTTVARVNRAARALSPENMHVSVVGPKGAKPTVLRAWADVSRARAPRRAR